MLTASSGGLIKHGLAADNVGSRFTRASGVTRGGGRTALQGVTPE